MRMSVKAFAALEDAAENVGGRARMAEKLRATGLGITNTALQNWKKVPLKYVRAVSKLSGVPHKELLPEIDFL